MHSFLRHSRLGAALLAVVMTGATLVLAGPASAATTYSSCDALTRDFRYGVAASKKAAKYQVSQGNHRPAHGKRARKVYAANASRLDRDKDGTACEQSR